ncbi:binding-protein-dependent transport system membrane protein [Bordetella ansorpii]|uniref:Binding-protein-dependent transport system membrane protein n=1 Tax=Bordetella ansorpii TaxID=288768 RepID=A0A157Q758_9BORD|nr:ABC transporter permease [Bordetella ansorpii]SAI41692.1 binding-protein-dependent transport system membrane protein [Bordetella ansorpii]
MTSNPVLRLVCRLAASIPGLVAAIGYLFLVGPIAIIVAASLSGGQEITFPPRDISFSLYEQFFADPAWWQPAIKSLLVAALTAALALFVTLPASYALARSKVRGNKAIELFFISPMLIPVVSLGLGVYIFFSSFHLDNTLAGLVLSHSTLVMPFMFISITAGLKHTDPALEAVSMLMGAGPLRTFFLVVVPQIKTSILVGLLFAFLISFDEVVIAYFITGPETTTLPVRMYSALRWEVSPVLTAISSLLTMASLVFCLGIVALQEKQPKSQN